MRHFLLPLSIAALPLGMLETFDAPEMTPNCECRSSTTVTPQSLLLMNSDFITQQSEEFARRLQKDAGGDAAAQIRLGWKSAFGTAPTEAQVAAAAAFAREPNPMWANGSS